MTGIFWVGVNIMGFIFLCFMYYNTGRQDTKQFPDIKLFRFLQIAVMLHLIFDTISFMMVEGFIAATPGWKYAVTSIYFATVPLPCFFWLLICDYKVWNDFIALKKRFQLYSIPLIIHTVFVLFTPLHGLTFYFDAENLYQRGALVAYTWITCWLYTFGSYPLLIVKTKNKPVLPPKGINFYYYLFQILPVIFSVIQILFYGTLFISLGMVIATFIIFANIYNRRLIDIAVERLEQELTQSRISIMLSQIQPHFLYNSLTAIKKLCATDPKGAEKAVVEFSHYLRGNMDSLTEKGLIPFEQERVHIEAYLNLEKAIYEKKLKVVYDIETKYFFIPPLTVQPIVENAVKHGVCQRLDGGKVTISVKETEAEHLITVADDGVGFDTTDTKPHIGITNVRSWLAVMCTGTLDIESEQGIGTTATIRIPKKGVNES